MTFESFKLSIELGIEYSELNLNTNRIPSFFEFKFLIGRFLVLIKLKINIVFQSELFNGQPCFNLDFQDQSSVSGQPAYF